MSGKEVVLSQVVSAQFIKELLPAAQKTALLYHMSYLCLANFPTLEKIIRANALEAQMLFSSSEALLVRCITTSDNMVNSLLPILLAAVQKDRRELAVKYLDKAATWIRNLIKDVEEIVDEYTTATKNVSSATSSVVKTKLDTEKKKEELTKEMEEFQKSVNQLQSKLQGVQSQLSSLNGQINSAEQHLQGLVNRQCQTNQNVACCALVIPFIGVLVISCQKNIKRDQDRAALNAARRKVSNLQNQRSSLSQKEWRVQTKLMDWQMKLAKAKMDLGAVPDPVHLSEVQSSLTRVQKILLQLKSFWEKVEAMLNSLRDKTTIGKDIVEDEDEFAILKYTLLDSIETAKEAWRGFMTACHRVRGAFTLHNNKAYDFLEISPSDLDEEQWQAQYNWVKARLDNISPSYSPAIEA